MRSIFVAALAAASVFLAGVAFADSHSMKRPLVTVASAPVGTPVVVAAESN